MNSRLLSGAHMPTCNVYMCMVYGHTFLECGAVEAVCIMLSCNALLLLCKTLRFETVALQKPHMSVYHTFHGVFSTQSRQVSE